MSSERVYPSNAKLSLRTSFSPENLRAKLKLHRPVPPLRSSIQPKNDDNQKIQLKESLIAETMQITPIKARNQNTESHIQHERISNMDSIPITDRNFPRNSDKGTLRSVSIGLDSQFTLTPRIPSQNSSSTRGNSKSPNLKEASVKIKEKIPKSQISAALKPYERPLENIGILSKEALMQNYQAAKKQITNDVNTSKAADSGLSFIDKIISLRTKLQPYEDSIAKYEQAEKEFSMRIRFKNASLNKKPWLSPLEIFKSDSPTRLKIPKRLPKLIMTAIKPQISARGSNDGSNLEMEQQEYPSTQRSKLIKNKVFSFGAQYSYDQSSVIKYIVDFNKLVNISDLLSKSINKDATPEQLEYQKLKNLIKKIKSEVENKPTLEDFSNSKETQECLRTKTLCLCVLKEQYEYIFRNNNPISDRLLFALDIDYKNELAHVDWGHYLSFIKTIVNYEASRLDSASFILRFFKGEEAHLTVTTFEKIAKSLLREYKNDSNSYQSAVELVSALYKSWDDLGIRHPHSEYINEEVFRSVYSNSRLDIYVLLNLITHRLF